MIMEYTAENVIKRIEHYVPNMPLLEKDLLKLCITAYLMNKNQSEEYIGAGLEKKYIDFIMLHGPGETTHEMYDPNFKASTSEEIASDTDDDTGIRFGIFDRLTFYIPLDPKTQGAISVSSLPGTERIGETFALYDRQVTLVHEVSHYILDLLGSIYDVELDTQETGSELNQAILAAAWSQSGGNLDTLVSKLTTWDNGTKIGIAAGNDASFENLYNNKRNFYTEIAGISNISDDLRRTGYSTHWKNGKVEGEWHKYKIKPDEYELIPGHYKNLLARNREGIVTLGNQYDNAFNKDGWGLLGTDFSDYLDGGNGNDFLDGQYGDDILIGGDGIDELIGGANNDDLYGGMKGGVDRRFQGGSSLWYGWRRLAGWE